MCRSKLNLLITFLCVVILMLSVSSCTVDGAERAARELLQAATEHMERAISERDSYSAALVFYDMSSTTLNSIVADYPSTRTAKELVSGKKRVAGLYFDDIMNRETPLRELSHAELSPILCSLIVAREISDDFERCKSLLEVSSEMIESGSQQKGLLTLNQVVASAEKIQDKVERAILFSGVAECLYQGAPSEGLDLVSRAVRLAHSLDPYNRSEQLTKAALVYFQMGETEVCRALLDEALESSLSIEEVSYKALALHSIASAYSELGDKDFAREALEKAWFSRDPETSMFMQGTLQSMLVDSYISLGDYETASRVARSISDELGKSRAFCSLAQAVDNGDARSAARRTAVQALRNALTEANVILEAQYRASALANIGSTQASLGIVESARETLESAYDTALRSGAPFATSTSLTTIASAYLVLDEEKKAKELLRESEYYADLERFDEFKSRAYRSIFIRYIEMGEVHSAMRACLRISDNAVLVTSLIGISKEMGSSSDEGFLTTCRAGLREITHKRKPIEVFWQPTE